MRQLGEAHKVMMRMMEWAKIELNELAANVPLNAEAGCLLDNARLHLLNALKIAEQIDSGVVYRLEGQE